MMNIAQSMKAIADKAKASIHVSQIMSKIKSAAKDGNYSITVRSSEIDSRQYQILKDLGFGVYSLGDPEETIISWY